MKSSAPRDQIQVIARQMARQRYWQNANLWAESDRRLAHFLKTYSGLHAELTFTDSVSGADVMAACLLADVTSLHLEGGIQVGFDVGPIDDSQWAFPHLGNSLRGRYRRIDYGCYIPLGADEVCTALKPLTAAGRLLVRSAPALFLEALDGTRLDVRIDRNLPDSLLLADRTCGSQEAIPVRRAQRCATGQTELVSFALPLLTNISFATYAKILDEDADVIASLRAEIKQLVAAAKQHDATIQERYADVVRPAIDRVQRRFRLAQRMHSLRTAGATLATLAVSLTALTTPGVLASVAAVLGPAGLGLVAKEVAEFTKAYTELREMPFYLLWRLQRAC